MKYVAYTLVSLATILATLAPVGAQVSVGRDAQSLTRLSDAFEAVVEAVGPAVVEILAVGYGASTSGHLSKQRSSGSGVVVDPNGYIITNAHVVAGARRVQVLLARPSDVSRRGRSIVRPEGELLGAQVVGVDTETDLAVLKVSATGLPYLELGDSDDLRQGEIVLAFGSPFGLEHSVSMGIVSSVSRQLTPDAPMVYIQTDATINPGNSGGPLLDSAGRVIGINTFIFTHTGGSEGVGFAAPSNIVRNVYNQLRTLGHVKRGHIGVNAQTITRTMATGLSLTQQWGVVAGDVLPGGPADEAGLRVGDVIVSMNGKKMENGRQFDVNLYRYGVGDKVTLEILRSGEKKTIRVPVIERGSDPARFLQLVSPKRNLVAKLGILGLDLDRTILQMLPPLRQEDGVVVAARTEGAAFQIDGLRPGDVIHMVNLENIRDVKTLRKATDNLTTGDAVVCQIERSGQMHFIAFEIDL